MVRISTNIITIESIISFVLDILMWFELEATVVTEVLVPNRRWNDGLILKRHVIDCSLGSFFRWQPCTWDNLVKTIKKNLRLSVLSESSWNDSRVFICINCRIRHFAECFRFFTLNPRVSTCLTPGQLRIFLKNWSKTMFCNIKKAKNSRLVTYCLGAVNSVEMSSFWGTRGMIVNFWFEPWCGPWRGGDFGDARQVVRDFRIIKVWFFVHFFWNFNFRLSIRIDGLIDIDNSQDTLLPLKKLN